ncbi:MAG: Crp/Fnr family transcriptional regulator [Cytophagales bacterium]|nr:Crp/Fnr family transcriptional regulator [Cytophagales bacterium]
MNMDVAKTLRKVGFEKKLVEEIVQLGRLKKVKAQSTVISPGTKNDEIPIVLSGLLMVMTKDENGNELFLYNLEGGQTCAMSITCCLEGKKNAFYVMVEEDSVLWMVPMAYMDSWIQKYFSFRKFVFSSYQARFDELLAAVDSMAFMKMDERLYKYLLDKKQATGSYVIAKTHQQIANELNTSRVVISRLLKQLEREEKIEQKRNRIEIL